MKLLRLGFIISFFLGLTACASIAGDNSRAVMVHSKPSGADILVDNQHYGVTPAIVNLPNYIYGGKSITVRKAGYRDQTKMVNAKFQPVSLFNILFWPGFIIDAATGNIVKVDPANLNLNYRLAKS